MEVKFYGKNFQFTPEIKSYVIGKLGRILKQSGDLVKDIRQIRVDLSKNFGYEKDEFVRLEINIDLLTGQKIIRAEETAPDAQTAMDGVEAELEAQIQKHKGRDKTMQIKEARLFKYLKSFDPLAFFRKKKDEK